MYESACLLKVPLSTYELGLECGGCMWVGELVL